MIGLGTQNTVEEAVEFVRATGTTSFPMYWDETFVSWTPFGLTGQPAAGLISPEGELIGAWLGPFDFDEVLESVRSR